MKQVLEALKSISKESKPVIIGMGNDVNADDGIGPMIAQALADLKFFISMDVGTLPENFTKKIAGICPSHVIILDAAMIEGEPGTVAIVDQDMVDEYVFTTHHIPISYTVQRIQAMCGAEVIIIGIRPDSLEMGRDMHPNVVGAAEKIVQVFRDLDEKLYTQGK